MQDYRNTKPEIGQVLSDIKATGKSKGKERPWRERKEESILLSESYKRLGIKVFESVLECGSLLIFKRFTNGVLRLHKAFFCKNRLCPMCAWRRSLKIFGQMSKVMNQGEKDENLRYLFLTLTVKNVEAEELSPTIDEMTKAFYRMKKRKVFESAIKGWFRALEVNHNDERGDYHPHFHVILAVNPKYFRRDMNLYINQQAWVNMWQQAMKLDYAPSVDVRRVRKNQKGKGIAEIAKYSVKIQDYIKKDDDEEVIENHTDWLVNVLHSSLKSRRMIAMGGIIKKLHKELNLDDMEDGKLTDSDIDEDREDLNYVLEAYSWKAGFCNYTLD